MLRRDFLRASGTAILSGLTGLAGLVSNSDAYPQFNYIYPPQYSFKTLIEEVDRLKRGSKEQKRNPLLTRKTLFFSYEEWKDFNHYRESPESSDKNRQVNGPHLVEIKALLLIQNPDTAFGFLTPKEIDSYTSEMNMQDPQDQIVDRIKINQKYTLHLTQEEFENNIGARIVWYLDRMHNYTNSDEKTKNKR